MEAQPLGKPLTVPLTNFDNLTGKTGIINRHQNTTCQQSDTVALEDFKQVMIDLTALDIHSSRPIDKRHKCEIELQSTNLKAYS
jgi:hypothetical protein